MINRELIRLKVVQMAYSLNLRGVDNLVAAENELLLSLSQAYQLYHHLLLLLVEMHRVARIEQETRDARARRLSLPMSRPNKFVTNRCIIQLAQNKQLLSFRDEQRTNWYDHEDFVRNLLKRMEESDFYRKYEACEDNTYEDDRELCRRIYRELICNNEELDALLEEQNLYWNDDKVIVDTFALKTINRFTAETGEDETLQPEYKDNADRDFATSLLRQSMKMSESNLSLIASTARNWEIDRIALMDRIILNIALTEITCFPEIPAPVSISEYVEIAKAYSTPKSCRYINATLDNIVKTLIKENKLIKSV